MKRWMLSAGLIIISGLGFAAPASAQASTTATTTLSSGKPVKVSISKVGQNVKYAFAATVNKNVTFNVTNFNFSDNGSGGGIYLNFYEPGSNSSYTNSYFSSNGYYNFTPPEGGTWTLVVSPYSDSRGSMTLTFANDVPNQALTSAKPVSTTIAYSGQYATYTFNATVNKNVTFNVTKFNFSDNGSGGGIYLYFNEPGSNSSYTNSYFSSNGYYNFTPPQSGTWSIVLVPYSASTGSLTLTFANDVPNQALSAGKPVSTVITYSGQYAGYTFGASGNKTYNFNVAKFNFTDNGSGGGIYLYFYEPGTSSSYTNCYFDSNGKCSFKTPAGSGGTWSIALVPYSASVGSLTLTLN